MPGMAKKLTFQKFIISVFLLVIFAALLAIGGRQPVVAASPAEGGHTSNLLPDQDPVLGEPQLLLRLRVGNFDPLAGEPAMPANLRRSTTAAEQAALRLVQFTGPIQDDWYQAMTKAGLEVVSYMPDYGYLVWGNEVSMESLKTAAPVRWSGLYHPFYALHPDLVDPSKLSTEVEVMIQVYDHPGADTTIQAIQDQATTIRSPQHVLVYRNLGVRLASDKLTWLVTLPDVVNVEPYPHYQMMDEVQGQIMAGNLNGAGTQPSGAGYLTWLTGVAGLPTTPSSYPIVDVTDDGIDNGSATPLHPVFYELGITSNPDRLIYNYNWTSDPLANGQDGHGNINASIVVGYNNATGSPHEDSNGYNYGLGINPFGRVAGSKVFANGGFWDTSATPADLISNS
jgi:hypothetical protein